MDRRVENKLKTLIDKSGNSDVDLIVNIETKAIAYSILCSSYAKGEIDEKQLEKAVKKLDSLIARDERKQRERNQILEFNANRNDSERFGRRKWI